MLRRTPGHRVLIVLGLVVLLVLAGFLPSQNERPRGSAVPDLSAASSPGAPAWVSLPSCGPGVSTTGRPTTGPAVVDIGSRLAGSTAGRILPRGERAGSELHRTSPGPGDHLAVGPVAGVQPDVTAAPAPSEGSAETPPGVPCTAFGARAPPVS